MPTIKHPFNPELLRPFDPEKARAGEPVCDKLGYCASKVVSIDDNGEVGCQWGSRVIVYFPPESLRMAPLTWLHGYPVYRGDKLFFDRWEFEVADLRDGYLHSACGRAEVALGSASWRSA